MYLTLEDRTVRYRVPREEFSGEDLGKLSAVLITPFLFASGGRMKVLDPDTLDWTEESQYRVPGYVLVPDGSGALIRFTDNTSVFNPYIGDVYGKDYATETYYYTELHDDVPVHDPVMPVFGMVHTADRIGFLSVIEQGDHAARIRAYPNGANNLNFDWVSAKYTYRMVYKQPTGPSSGAVDMLTENPRRFDIVQHFLL